jgi:hypothetical protein
VICFAAVGLSSANSRASSLTVSMISTPRGLPICQNDFIGQKEGPGDVDGCDVWSLWRKIIFDKKRYSMVNEGDSPNAITQIQDTVDIPMGTALATLVRTGSFPDPAPACYKAFSSNNR